MPEDLEYKEIQVDDHTCPEGKYAECTEQMNRTIPVTFEKNQQQ